MIVRRSRSVNRVAFTLVELLMVVTIIAVLVSLVAAAVMKVMGTVPEVETSSEIAELGSALGAFMADFQLDTPPPSSLTLNSSPAGYGAGDPSFAFLKKVFTKNIFTQGNISWGGTSGSGTLTGEQCLVFYLGGINNQGFSYNKANPTPVAGQRTHGPYFQFKTSRLVPGPGGFLMYLDAWQVKAGPKPYAYFSSGGINNKYAPILSAVGATPYFTAAGQYINPNGYQIISAGKDGAFGNGSLATGVAVGTGADDQANFSSTKLGAGQK